MTTSYTTDDLQHSDDDMIVCAHCCIAIMPATDTTVYLVGAREGFHFFHAGSCAKAALAEAAIA